jgi:hypothetical protein
MSLESGTTISALVSTNPELLDPVYGGAKHFWLVKSVLKHTFPGAAGQGFASPITATEAELNYCSGVTSGIQGQINVLTAGLNAQAAKGVPILKRDGATTVSVALA